MARSRLSKAGRGGHSAWQAWPALKRRLNQQQAAEIAARGVGPQRGAVRDALTLFDEFGALCALAQDAGGSTQSTHFVVEAIDAHHRRAVAAGAEVVIELRDEDYGGRGYSAKDPEGNLWNFGSYDPWADPT